MDITQAFIPQSMDASLTRGGVRIRGQIIGDTDAIDLGRNVQLRGKSGAGGSIDPDWRVFFDGHALSDPDNIEFDKHASSAVLEIGTADNLLHGYLQDIGFREDSSPSNEHQITGLDMAAMVEHILRRHCNAVYNAIRTPDGVITSLTIDGNSTAVALRNVRKSNSLWKRLQEIGGGEEAGEFYRCWFDRKNRFYYQPAPAFWTTPPASLGSLTADHLRGPVRVRLNNNRPTERVGQVQLYAVGGGSTVYTAEFPAVQADGTIHQVSSGVWADSQSRANTLAQRLYEWLTRPYTLQIEIDPGLLLYGDDGNGLDLADAVTVVYNGPADDGGAGVHLNLNQKFYIYAYAVRFDVTGKSASATLTLEADNAS